MERDWASRLLAREMRSGGRKDMVGRRVERAVSVGVGMVGVLEKSGCSGERSCKLRQLGDAHWNTKDAKPRDPFHTYIVSMYSAIAIICLTVPPRRPAIAVYRANSQAGASNVDDTTPVPHC